MAGAAGPGASQCIRGGENKNPQTAARRKRAKETAGAVKALWRAAVAKERTGLAWPWGCGARAPPVP